MYFKIISCSIRYLVYVTVQINLVVVGIIVVAVVVVVVDRLETASDLTSRAVEYGPPNEPITVCELQFQKQVRGFHRISKRDKTFENTRPQSEWFYCFRAFGNLMKPEAQVIKFLKLFLQQRKLV